MWCLAHPKIGEREVVAALLDREHHLIRDGQVLLADKGFAGREFKRATDTMRLRLLRPTAVTRPTATATSAGSASGSSRSTRPSRASSTSNATVHAPTRAFSPGSQPVYSPWPPASGTTGPVA